MDANRETFLRNADLRASFVLAADALDRAREEKRIKKECEIELRRKRLNARLLALDIPVDSLQADVLRGMSTRDNRHFTSKANMLGRSREQGIITHCGRFLDLWLSIENVHTGKSVAGQKKQTSKAPEEEESIARRVNSRARKQIRRIVNANNLQGMYTLTLAPPSAENDKSYRTVPVETQRDYEAVRMLFKQFVQRLSRRLARLNRRVKVVSGRPKKVGGEKMEYLAVFEQHNSDRTSPEKRYTWHIHLAVPVDSGKFKRLVEKAWKHGMIDWQDFRFDKAGNRREVDIQNPGAYIAEYIGKDGVQFGQAELRSKKRYTKSKGLKKPVKSYLSENDITGNLNQMIVNGKKYKCTFYREQRIPDTDRIGINAQYMEV